MVEIDAWIFWTLILKNHLQLRAEPQINQRLDFDVTLQTTILLQLKKLLQN